MARDQQRSIVFFHYLSMGSVTEIDFGFIKIWNYPLAGDTHLPDEKTRIHIKRVFSTYQSEGRAIEGMGIVAIGGVSDFSDLESEHLKRIKEVRLLLFLSFVARNNTLPLLGKAMQTRHGAAFWLLAYSGMRRGEVCSVKREHLDLEAGTPMEAISIDRVFIGSCTNGRVEDLREAAAILEGHHVHESVNAMVVPGSAAVKRQAEAEGLAQIFRDAGFDWREAGCSMCLAMNPDKLVGREFCASSSNLLENPK